MLISLIIFIFILIYVVNKILNRKIFINEIRGKSQNNLLRYRKFLWKIRNNDFDMSEAFAKDFSRHQKRGMFYVNLHFMKIVTMFRPEHTQVLLKDPENVDKSILYQGLTGWAGNSILMRKGKKWKQHRKFLAPSFYPINLESYISKSEIHAKTLTEKLKDNNPETMDIINLIKKCTLGVMYDTILEVPENSSFRNYSLHIDLMEDIMKPALLRAFNIFLWPDFLFGLTSKGKKFIKAKSKMIESVKQLVEEKMNQLKINRTEEENETRKIEKKAFIDYLIESLHKNPDNTIESICEDVLFFMFAGHETTALTLCWILYLLGKHPDVQKKVQEEVDNIFGDESATGISKEDLQKMIYLECVIKETMRLYPAIPFISRKSNKCLSIGGDVFPKDSIYVIAIYHQHHNPYVFPDPEKFDPDRFLPENLGDMHRYSYIPFALGHRICMGYRFAMMEMKIVVATIMKDLNVESLRETLPSLTFTSLYPKEPFQIKRSLRSKLCRP